MHSRNQVLIWATHCTALFVSVVSLFVVVAFGNTFVKSTAKLVLLVDC